MKVYVQQRASAQPGAHFLIWALVSRRILYNMGLLFIIELCPSSVFSQEEAFDQPEASAQSGTLASSNLIQSSAQLTALTSKSILPSMRLVST